MIIAESSGITQGHDVNGYVGRIKYRCRNVGREGLNMFNVRIRIRCDLAGSYTAFGSQEFKYNSID